MHTEIFKITVQVALILKFTPKMVKLTLTTVKLMLYTINPPTCQSSSVHNENHKPDQFVSMNL